MLGRAAYDASLDLDRKIESMLVQLEFRFVVSYADEALKQKGLELIADSLHERRQPSKAAMLAFLSEAKKTA
jgi:hypothetical protein